MSPDIFVLSALTSACPCARLLPVNPAVLGARGQWLWGSPSGDVQLFGVKLGAPWCSQGHAGTLWLSPGCIQWPEPQNLLASLAGGDG